MVLGLTLLSMGFVGFAFRNYLQIWLESQRPFDENMENYLQSWQLQIRKEIAETVGRDECNCRKCRSRSRRAVQASIQEQLNRIESSLVDISIQQRRGRGRRHRVYGSEDLDTTDTEEDDNGGQPKVISVEAGPRPNNMRHDVSKMD